MTDMGSHQDPLGEGDEVAVADEWPDEWRASTPGRTCPSCGAAAGRPIVWGLPEPELFAANDTGEIDVHFGGCCVSDDDPAYVCTVCGWAFGRAEVAAGPNTDATPSAIADDPRRPPSARR